jgi:predicted nuclease of predicted toxin-antitoxin system
MKIKLDENLPSGLAKILAQLGHDADAITDEGLAGSDDPQVWEAAQRTGRFLITQDLDFSDIRKFAPGTHHGILLVRLREPGRVALMRRIRYLFETEDTEQWQRCFVVVTEHKIRVRRP